MGVEQAMIEEQPEEDDDEEETDLLEQMDQANLKYEDDLRAAAEQALNF